MKRRSLKSLQGAVESASEKREKACAYYELGVFHDNNGREANRISAISHIHRARQAFQGAHLGTTHREPIALGVAALL